MTWDASDLTHVARDMRRAADGRARRRYTGRVREVAEPIAAEIRGGISEHFEGGEEAAAAGVKVSADKGGSITVGGAHAPASWAYAFTVGNAGAGRLAHPDWGHWHTGARDRTQRSHPEIVDVAWAKGKEAFRAAALAALEELVLDVVWGG